MCVLFFLHPGGEARLGWLMWKAWLEVKRAASCRALSDGVSAAQEEEAGADSQALIQ